MIILLKKKAPNLMIHQKTIPYLHKLTISDRRSWSIGLELIKKEKIREIGRCVLQIPNVIIKVAANIECLKKKKPYY